MKVKFNNWNCVVETSYYVNDSEKIALLLIDADTGERIATASVNMEEPFPLDCSKKEHVWIKTWSENEGILEALVEAGVVEQVKHQLINEYGAIAQLVRVLPQVEY